MATFLTTSKMSPELAARVEASVEGRTRSTTSRSPRVVVVGRLIVLFAVVAVVGFISFQWQSRASEEDRLRATLLSDVERERGVLSEREHQLVSRAKALLAEAASAPTAAEVMPDSATLARALDAASVYMRGPIDAVADAARIDQAVADSVKDAFVLCLVEPPKTHAERTLLERVQLAYSGGLDKRTPHVHRLHTAALALPLLSREWMKRVEEADSIVELAQLRTAFDRAPVARAQAAARATVLIYWLDESPAPGARIELDGASAHQVRVGIVDIASGKALLRVRRAVDPAWISEDNRAQLGNGLSGCRLAFDVRTEVAGAPPGAK